MPGINFCENTWSQRLCGGLNKIIPGYQASLTANDGLKFVTKQQRDTGLPVDLCDCYLFRGAPDIASAPRSPQRAWYKLHAHALIIS